MPARLLVALLIALLPLPASARACHAPAPVAQASAHGHAPANPREPEQRPLVDQLCVGCVVPATARTPQLSPPLAFARDDAPPAMLAGAALASGPPATPPPRVA